MILACIDGGLICGPILAAGLAVVLGWLGLRKLRCKQSGCEHKCDDPRRQGHEY